MAYDTTVSVCRDFITQSSHYYAGVPARKFRDLFKLAQQVQEPSQDWHPAILDSSSTFFPCQPSSWTPDQESWYSKAPIPASNTYFQWPHVWLAVWPTYKAETVRWQLFASFWLKVLATPGGTLPTSSLAVSLTQQNTFPSSIPMSIKF